MKYGTPSEVPLLWLLLLLVEVMVVVQGTSLENKVHMAWVSVTNIPIVQSDPIATHPTPRGRLPWRRATTERPVIQGEGTTATKEELTDWQTAEREGVSV